MAAEVVELLKDSLKLASVVGVLHSVERLLKLDPWKAGQSTTVAPLKVERTRGSADVAPLAFEALEERSVSPSEEEVLGFNAGH